MADSPCGSRRRRFPEHRPLDIQALRKTTGEHLLQHSIPRHRSIDGRTAHCRSQGTQRYRGRTHDDSRRAERTKRPPLRAVPSRAPQRRAGNRDTTPTPRFDGSASPPRSWGRQDQLAASRQLYAVSSRIPPGSSCEPFEPPNPPGEMGALASDPRQADPLGSLDSNCRLVVLVPWHLVDDSFGRSTMTSVVDQLW